MAQRILESLRLAVPHGSRSSASAGSIGIAFDEPGITSEQLLRNADIAMYKAKESGKDRFEIYREEMHAAVLARIEQERDLRAAIHDGDLLTHYQPIYDLDTRRIIGFEALVRWAHPIGGLVDPRLFVSLAEELGLIEEIDSFVLRSACMQARQWREEGLWDSGLVMSVNLSPGRLIDPDLAQRITTQLEECQFDPRSLILEITESAMLADNETTVRNLAELRSLGVRIALDDFGTGYSSLSHLDRLQVDIVKIDKSFVQTLGLRRRLARPGRRHGAVGPHARLRDDRRGRGEPGPGARAPGAGVPVRPGVPPRSTAQHRMYRPLAQGPGCARPGRRHPLEGLSRHSPALRPHPGEPWPHVLAELRLRGSSGWRPLGAPR